VIDPKRSRVLLMKELGEDSSNVSSPS
jgi:hypothetical protein